MSPFVAWKSRRIKKLRAAYDKQSGPHSCPADWQDFCEAEYGKWLRKEERHDKWLLRGDA
ncbi:hypothetical protein D9M68_789870 [compost metagenome]